MRRGPIFNEKQANIVQKSTFLIKNNVFRSLFRFSTYSSYSTYSPNYATEIKICKKIQNYFDEHLTKICSENNCTYKLKLTFRGMPFQSFDNPFTKHCIKAIKDVTGLEASQDTGGGTSDARFMQEVCPVFEFGTINKTLHKVNECVSIEDLKTTEQIYYKTLENFFDI